MLLRSFSVASVAVVLTLIAFSCSRPESEGKFVRVEDRQIDGTYLFEADMSDSLCAYDLTLYAKIDKKNVSIGGLPFVVRLVSPSGKIFTETVYMKNSDKIRSSFYSSDFKALYRSGLVPTEFGLWSVRIKTGHIDKLLGVGLVVSRNSLKPVG